MCCVNEHHLNSIIINNTPITLHYNYTALNEEYVGRRGPSAKMGLTPSTKKLANDIWRIN